VRAERVVVSDGEPLLFGLEHVREADRTARDRDVKALRELLESVSSADLRRRIAALLERFEGEPTAEQLAAVLDPHAQDANGEPAIEESPYRGLRPFEAEHAPLFFGRRAEVATLVDRLRAQPLLLVAGQSGAGKSSLVRAGLGPAVAAGALGERASWGIAVMTPGSSPLHALADALAPHVRLAAEDLRERWQDGFEPWDGLLEGLGDRGLLLVVDQLEECLTLCEPEQRNAFVAVVRRFGVLTPGVRIVMTLRSDFLERLDDLGPLGQGLLLATFVLPAMSRDGLREVIVRPARVRGFEFEDPSTIEALVDEVSANAGTLPLLSFALAELWRERDAARRMIPSQALTRLGGARAALASHGEVVLATLKPEERREARRLLLTLVTASETRARPTERDLVVGTGPAERAALSALVRARLVVAGDTYELAHEALVHSWPRLRAWLDEASAGRAAAARLSAAVRDWERLGRSAEALWGARQLRDLEAPGALDGAGEGARHFVSASRSVVRRARLRRRLLALGVPLVLSSIGSLGWGIFAARIRAKTAGAVAEARTHVAQAEAAARSAEGVCAGAFAAFAEEDADRAEEAWKRCLSLEDDADGQRREAAISLDRALALDPTNPGARVLNADVVLERLLAAERLHRSRLSSELRAQLALYDDGSRLARLQAPDRVRVETEPAGAALTLSRYRETPEGDLVESDPIPIQDGSERRLAPGSYLLVARQPDRYLTRYPFFLVRGEERVLHVVLPLAASVPEGMLYVPAGRVFYGSEEDEATRQVLEHQPMHEREVPAFLIARTEVTNGAFAEYLRSSIGGGSGGRLPGGFTRARGGRLSLRIDGRTFEEGELYCPWGQPCVDWVQLPLGGVSYDDGLRYAAWLARARGLAGARVCTDLEWERAARGADDRHFPAGNREPGPTDACTLGTYGGDPRRAGPCAVATHPSTRSIFGVEDMVGSQFEWTSSPAMAVRDHRAIEQARAGSYRDGGLLSTTTLHARPAWDSDGEYAEVLLPSSDRPYDLLIPNRYHLGRREAYSQVGLRICADAP
jgi:formylglycine-generating enzyme required for sulfatase activity